MKLKDKEIADLYKKLGDLDVITFDPKEVECKIADAYVMREEAHRLLLQSDILLDEVLKQIYGETKNRKTRGKVNKGTKS